MRSGPPTWCSVPFDRRSWVLLPLVAKQTKCVFQYKVPRSGYVLRYMYSYRNFRYAYDRRTLWPAQWNDNLNAKLISLNSLILSIT